MDLYMKLLVEVQFRRNETKQFEVEWRDRMKSSKNDPKDPYETTRGIVNEGGKQRKKWEVAVEHEEMLRSLVEGDYDTNLLPGWQVSESR